MGEGNQPKFMPIARQTTLFNTQGSSDKFYTIQIFRHSYTQSYFVFGFYGKRLAIGQPPYVATDTHTINMVVKASETGITNAEYIYNEIISQKAAKGYRAGVPQNTNLNMTAKITDMLRNAHMGGINARIRAAAGHAKPNQAKEKVVAAKPKVPVDVERRIFIAD